MDCKSYSAAEKRSTELTPHAFRGSLERFAERMKLGKNRANSHKPIRRDRNGFVNAEPFGEVPTHLGVSLYANLNLKIELFHIVDNVAARARRQGPEVLDRPEKRQNEMLRRVS